MARRNPVRWLMTDERMGDALWPALARLPPGSGVIFRHHATPAAARRALLRRVERIAAARRLVLVVAGGGGGKAGVHGSRSFRHPGRVPRSRAGQRAAHGSGGRVEPGLTEGDRPLRTASAHSRREAIRAVRAGAGLLFVSPVFATRSHPGAAPLGPGGAARIARGLGVTVIALGGMDERRWRRIRALGYDGWAAIDAWTQAGSTVREG